MHPLRPIAVPVLASLALSAVCALSQTQQSASAVSVPASSQPAAAENSGVTVLRADTNLVLVDVVVTARDRAVHGIDQRRFHIFEDGHEQTITSFDEHQPDAAPGPAVLPAPLPPHTWTNIPQYPPAPAVNVLLLDGLNTPVADQMRARLQMLEFMSQIQPGTSLAVFTLSSRLRMVTGFTTDTAGLIQALKSSKSSPSPSVVLDSEGAQDLNELTNELAANGADSDAVASMQQFEADVAAVQIDQRVAMTLDALQQLGRYLSAIPGRKNLIWFSGSFPIVLDADDSLSSPFEVMRDYSEQIKETSELLSASRVAVYPVDARGLMTPPSFNASYSSSGSRMGTTRSSSGGAGNSDDAKFMKQLMNEQATLQQIAEETGGHAFINTNGLKEAVASAVENGSNYYTIGYTPTAKTFDGRYRKLQIKIDNSDYKLAYRRGYVADDPEKPSGHPPGPANSRQVGLFIASTLHGVPPATQILFKAQVLAATDPLLKDVKLPEGKAGELTATLKGPIHRYIVDLRMDSTAGHGIDFEAMPDGTRIGRVEFALVAFDTEGKRLNYYEVGIALKPNAQQYAQLAARGLPVRLAIDLPEGQAYLRVAVHDLSADRTGSLELPLLVAAK